MERTVKKKIKGRRTIDGAGVSLVRVLGEENVKEFDPILMLDSFDSTNPKEYTAGFPMHPHRGIETISYLLKGNMIHKDSLGNEESISDGELQWMNSGSGILHEELLPPSEKLLGVQIWLNLPAKYKMSMPTYESIRKSQIPEIKIEDGNLRLLAGNYKEYQAYKGNFLPLDYYDIHLKAQGKIKLEMNTDDSVMLFTLLGEIFVNGELIEEKTAVKLSDGNCLTIKTGAKDAHILYINSRSLNEPIAWAGPVVMNTEQELHQAFLEMRENTFIKESVSYKK